MRLKLKNVRIAFCQNLWTPGVPTNATPGTKPAYSASFLIPKDDTKTIRMVQDAIQTAAKEKWKDKAGIMLKQAEAKDRTPLNDGDLKADKYDGFEGCMYFSARSTKTPPLVINQKREPLAENSGILFSGCYVNASFDLFGYTTGQIGVGAQLRGVQFVADGDAFAAGAPASADEFDEIADTGDNDDLV